MAKAQKCYMPDGTEAQVALVYLRAEEGDKVHEVVNVQGTGEELLFGIGQVLKSMKVPFSVALAGLMATYATGDEDDDEGVE